MSDKQHLSPSRRRFLKTGALAGAAGLWTAKPALAMTSPQTGGRSGQARNVIFMVADGMCHGTLGLAHHWQLKHRGERLSWMQLYDRPDLHSALQDTASASSPVTDSAAAASAWGSGRRVPNGQINITAEGSSLKPILRYAKDAGMATGLVSTCRITHATPAGFATAVADRDEEDSIARQYLEAEVDVLLGGGYRHFKNEEQDLLPAYAEAGYRLCRDVADLRGANRAAKLLGLFSRSHIPYALDRKNDRSLKVVPGLADMMRSSLQSLAGRDEGFFLQVEGGRVDHAGHANDPGAILHELLEFDACIPIALRFLERNPDTLLIVTTDHGTGGCQLNGWGDSYNDSGPALDRINRLTYSFEWLEKHYRASGQFTAEPLVKATGIEPLPEQATAMQAAIDDPELKYLTSRIAEIFEPQLKEMTATGWTSTKHTGENVELLAFGAGAAPVRGYLKNYEMFKVVTDALGLRT